MGVDTHLHLSSKWKIEDIVDVLKQTQKADNIKVTPSESMPGYGNIELLDIGRSIFYGMASNTPIGSCTYLSLRSNKQGIQIFRDVAEVLGGLLTPEDCNDQCEMIYGKVSPDDGLPYFIQYAILHDGIAPDDLQGMINSIKNWYDNTKSTNHNELKTMANKLYKEVI